MKLTTWSCCLTSLLLSSLPATAAAQPVEDAESPGPSETVLLFHAGDEDDGPLPISILSRLPDQTEEYQEVCSTPCSYRVPNGAYQFLVGQRRSFEVTADGGVQLWRLADNSLGRIIAGAAMLGVGAGAFLPLGLGIVGGTDGFTDGLSGDFYVAMLQVFGWCAIVLGAAVGVAGAIVWSTAYGYDEMVLLDPSSTPTLAPSVALPPVLPSLLAGRSPDGHDFFGLALTLTL